MLGKPMGHVVATLVIAAGFSSGAYGGNKKEDGYRQVVEARADQAVKDNNVDALVESAYALFPLEAFSNAKEPKYLKLLEQAGDLVLAGGKAKDAQRFLTMAAALSEALPKAKRDQLTKLAVGTTPAVVASEEINRAVPKIKQRGSDLVDPEIKTRGPEDRALAETLGRAILVTIRPSTLVSGGSSLVSYNLSFPGPNRCALSLRMSWRGVFTDNPYSSDITINLLVQGRSSEILGVDYYDNCFFPPPDLRLIQGIMRELNNSLR